ncbi:sulfotransferase domain-containing protein, partial [Frankia sp. AvcI1]
TLSSWPWRYLALGRYGAQVQRLYTLFARQQVLLVPYPELSTDPARALGHVHRFLGLGRHRDPAGVDRAYRPAEVPVERCGDLVAPGCAEPAVAAAARRLDPAVAARLHAGFGADLDLLDQVTGRRWALRPAPD